MNIDTLIDNNIVKEKISSKLRRINKITKLKLSKYSKYFITI